jgi:hypothetical protein
VQLPVLLPDTEPTGVPVVVIWVPEADRRVAVDRMQRVESLALQQILDKDGTPRWLLLAHMPGQPLPMGLAQFGGEHAPEWRWPQGVAAHGDRVVVVLAPVRKQRQEIPWRDLALVRVLDVKRAGPAGVLTR